MLFRFIFYAVVAWFVFRWLDGFFGPSKKSGTSGQPGKKPSASKTRKDVGEYVDYEEVKDDEK
jgi:hypothetical protein